MRNIAVLILLATFGCSQSMQEGTFVISGEAENVPNGGVVVIERLAETGGKVLDSAQVTNQAFELVIDSDQIEPSFYALTFNNRQKAIIILTGEEQNVSVKADGSKPTGAFQISGSKDTDYKLQMDGVMRNYQAQMKTMQGQQMEARMSRDLTLMQEVATTMQVLASKTESELKALINEAAPSLAAIYGTQMIQAEKNLSFLDSVASKVSEKYPEHFLVAELKNKIVTTQVLAVGAEAPEISLPNPAGEMVNLSSLRGKYVLIDFWAAWCKPCRAENPNVVRVYQEYASKDFEILGVSLDRTRNAWLGAIEQDGLPWLHVSDLKYWRSEAAQTYQITAIPATYLIDPDGKIIAKNLRGASLEAKLKEIFG